MRLEHSVDYELIRTLISHPSVYPHFVDDFAPAAENFWPNEARAVIHLLVYDGAELLGLFITHAINPLLWEWHVCLLPCAYGRRARAAGKTFLAWLWANTQAVKVIGFVPHHNSLAQRYARGLGFAQAGVFTRCYQSGSVLRDLIIFSKDKR